MDGAQTEATARPASKKKAAAEQKTLNLALQGGGAHGAFTWGVLDRLAEDERIAIDGISATSAGAMNAVAFTYGWSQGGRQGARQALANFWRRISHAALLGPLQPSWLDRALHNHSLQFSPAFVALDLVSRLFSPYEFNPFNQNPLRDVLEASVDFEALRRSDCPIKLFLSATNVRSGKVKVFERNEVCPDRTLASACLPFLFQAVEIEGEHYWDGGYMGNPALFPLIYNCESRDIVVVHINPLNRDKLPRTATEIMNRINEISFNSSLMREMRAISFVTRLIEDGKVNGDGLRHLLIHSISAEEEMGRLGVASKLNGDWEFLTHLRDIGRDHATAWLERNFDRLGVESTVDIREQYL
ncbi:MAG TPA: patatin-like phospholipase family protein [Stellaceae bacterium]|nr:patatin-like phospholipase family protein [Stellaceae bacterium]